MDANYSKSCGGIVETPQCDGKPNNRDFTGESYTRRWNWDELDLHGANFAGLHFPHVMFSKSILRGANFSGARFGTLMG
ncbi:MAG: pentapeptide repeat-containing protein [Acaryochloridaceae cyanobacterium RU_4_10]|nr:pentapeptide repeat-containing protein [Acaryochloridaceae cyanobacterium RU_4_10]